MRVFLADAFSTRGAQDNTDGLLKAYQGVAEVKAFDYRQDIERYGGKAGRRSREALNARFLAQAIAFKPDLLHLSKCELINPHVVRAIKDKVGCKVAHKVGDWRAEPIPWAVALGKEADLFLVQHQDKDATRDYVKLGIKRVEFWPAGVDAEIFKPYAIPEPHDVVFIANFPLDPFSETKAGQGNRPQFLMSLARAGIKVRLYGNSTTVLAKHHKNLMGHPFVSGEALARVLCSAKIVLGYNADAGYCYTSWPRPFKAMACGRFYLAKYWPGMEEVFTTVEGVMLFENYEEAPVLIQHYIQSSH